MLDGTEMMVTEAIEALSSPTSPASSILFVLCSRPLHRAPLEATGLSWPRWGSEVTEVTVGVTASDLWRLTSESLFWLLELDMTIRPQPPRPLPLPRPLEARAGLSEASTSSLDLTSSINFFSSSFRSKTNYTINESIDSYLHFCSDFLLPINDKSNLDCLLRKCANKYCSQNPICAPP